LFVPDASAEPDDDRNGGCGGKDRAENGAEDVYFGA